MKTVILCGGMGTRLAEETSIRPKPMVTIGGYPILWHLMNLYGTAGYKEFVLALGYKGALIKEYFLNYRALSSDLEIDLATGTASHLAPSRRDWKVQLVDTGEKTLTGGRLLRVEKLLRPLGTFMLTYGDGLSNLSIESLVRFHQSHGKIATITSVRPISRFGEMLVEENRVVRFKEKPQSETGWMNGGFFVFEPEVFDYLENDFSTLEKAPLERLAADGQLMAFQHTGFWHCMDTIRDRQALESAWASGDAPWKVWND